MIFFDLKQFKAVEMNRYSTLKVKLDANKYLDMPLSDGVKYIQEVLSVNYKSPAVLTQITIINFEGCSEEDFVTICDNVASALVLHNSTGILRTEEEKKKVMNKLPSNRWVLTKACLKQLHCIESTIYKCGEYEYKNRFINLQINTANGDYKYEMVTNNEDIN